MTLRPPESLRENWQELDEKDAILLQQAVEKLVRFDHQSGRDSRGDGYWYENGERFALLTVARSNNNEYFSRKNSKL